MNTRTRGRRRSSRSCRRARYAVSVVWTRPADAAGVGGSAAAGAAGAASGSAAVRGGGGGGAGATTG